MEKSQGLTALLFFMVAFPFFSRVGVCFRWKNLEKISTKGALVFFPSEPIFQLHNIAVERVKKFDSRAKIWYTYIVNEKKEAN